MVISKSNTVTEAERLGIHIHKHKALGETSLGRVPSEGYHGASGPQDSITYLRKGGKRARGKGIVVAKSFSEFTGSVCWVYTYCTMGLLGFLGYVLIGVGPGAAIFKEFIAPRWAGSLLKLVTLFPLFNMTNPECFWSQPFHSSTLSSKRFLLDLCSPLECHSMETIWGTFIDKCGVHSTTVYILVDRGSVEAACVEADQ